MRRELGLALAIALTLSALSIAYGLSTFYVHVWSEVTPYERKFNMSYFRVYAFFESYFLGVLLQNGSLILFESPENASAFMEVELVSYGKDYALVALNVSEDVQRIYFGIRHRRYDELVVMMRDLRNYAWDFMYMDIRKPRRAVIVTDPWMRIIGNYTSFRIEPTVKEFKLLIAFYVSGPAFIVILFPLFFIVAYLDVIYVRRYLRAFSKKSSRIMMPKLLIDAMKNPLSLP